MRAKKIRAKDDLKRWEERARARLRLLFKKASRELRSPSGKVMGLDSVRILFPVSVCMVGNVKMTKLNRKYRGKAHATDVLSFSAPKWVRAIGFLGELVISVPVLKRQAHDFGHSQALELDILLVHGLLHLLGWDHERSKREARLMADCERTCLKRLGVIDLPNGLIDRSASLG